MIILSVDVMGFENKPNEAVVACRKFCKKYKNIKIILVGNKEEIIKCLKSKDNFDIEDSKDIINMDDNPISSRNKIDSSMYKAISLVANKKANGVLSAGQTSSFVLLSFMLLGKIDKISKHGFMPFVPTRNNRGFNFLDVGAQKECSGLDLLHFSIMANVYAKKIRNIENPTIGILNIGTEINKGFQYHNDADKILKERKDLNYIGFVEPRNLLEGIVDIVISDGFTGNLVLKAIEGSFKTIAKSLLDEYKKPSGWLGYLFSLPPLYKLKKKFDYKKHSGALVIGLNEIAVKTHGNADRKQFYSSLILLKNSIEFNIINDIRKQIDNE